MNDTPATPSATPIPKNWIRPSELRRNGDSRVGMLADVQLVCGVGPYEIDVLVREFDGPRSVDFVGQITRADRIHEPMGELALTLIDAARQAPVRATATNEFGEFSFERQRDSAYGLRLGDAEDAPCILVWEGAA